jgi:thiamine transport system substrate-binding protein
MKALPMIAGILLASPTLAADKPVLNVYTYDSFATEWGPGPAIETGFEATCACDLRWTTAGDGAALLSRVMLEGATSDADVVVGLDVNLIAKARESGLFQPNSVPSTVWALPVEWTDTTFLPFDWGWFAFVYDKTKLAEPPASLSALAASEVKVIIQDPRSSTPGLGLLLWVKAAYGDGAAQIWADLADNVVTVTPGWSEAYGLFLEGEADMVLSYTTSPAYHLIAEGDDSKAAAEFSEGHMLQVEVAAKLAATDQPGLAEAFLAYLVSDAAQAVIPTANWMYPAMTPEAGLPEGFETLIQPEQSLFMAPDEASGMRDTAVAEWQGALSQ